VQGEGDYRAARRHRRKGQETWQSSQRTVIAQADVERKVALEQCEALSGSPQEACKEMADERYELSKADAERVRGGM